MVKDNIIDYAAIGKRVKIARINQSLSQEVLAEKAEMSIQFLSNIENAKSKASLATFVKIANALDLTVDDLIYDSLKKNRVEFEKQIATILKDCSDYEVRVLANSLNGIKQALRECETFKEKHSRLQH